MATEVETNGEPGVTTLISGIVQDARELFVEQLTLFQVEIKNDIRRTMSAVAPLMAGLAVILTALIMFGISGADLLVWSVPQMPVWAAYGIVGGILALAGALLVLWGKSILDKVHAIPDTALKGLKENIQWKTKK